MIARELDTVNLPAIGDADSILEGELWMARPRVATKPKKKSAARKAPAKKRTATAAWTKAAAKPRPKPPLISLADFRADFIETMRRADADLVCEADADSLSIVNTGWWDGVYDPYDLAPAYRRYVRDPAKLDAIMDGILTRVYSRLPKDGPDSEQKRFS